MIDPAVLLEKAVESLTGAESELANGRFNNAANRAYYACFQAAVVALRRAGVQARGRLWGHDFVQAEFVRLLINQRKLYSSNLRETLTRNFLLRQTADYFDVPVSQIEATRALRRTREFVEAVRSREDEA